MTANNHYFTFSNNGNQAYKGGHIIIKADNHKLARDKYYETFGELNFAFSYAEEEWEDAKSKGLIGFNKRLWEVFR
jgi:hypothetical protein